MNKKYFLCALTLSATLTPIFAPSSNGSSDGRAPTFTETVSAFAVFGALYYALFGGEAPRKEQPMPQAPKPIITDRRQEKLTQRILDVFSKGEKNALEGYISENLRRNNYQVFLKEDKKDIETLFRDVEGFVREKIPCSNQREYVAKRVRVLRDDFRKDYELSAYKDIDRELIRWGAGVIRPDSYVSILLDILKQAETIVC